MPYQLNLATFAPLQHLYGVFEAYCHGTSFLQVRLVPSCLFFRLPFSQSVSRHPHARYITSLCGHPSLTQPPSPSLQGTLMRVTLRACVVILLSSSHPPLPYKAPSCALHYELVWSSFSHPATLPFPTRHPHARYITSLCGHPSLIQSRSPSLQGTLLPYKAPSCALHYELVSKSL